MLHQRPSTGSRDLTAARVGWRALDGPGMLDAPTTTMPNRPLRDTDLRDTSERIRTYTLFAVFLFFFATLTGGALMRAGAIPRGLAGWLVLYAGVAVLTAVLGSLTLWLADRSGGLLARVLYAGGETSAEPPFSYEDTLVVQGRLDEAERAFEQRCLDNPEDGEARIRRADFYDRTRKDPVRAERFYREAQRLGLPPSRDLYVSQCLLDLCRRAERTEALRRELRRIIERYGDSTAGRSAEAELESLGEEPGSSVGRG